MRLVSPLFDTLHLDLRLVRVLPERADVSAQCSIYSGLGFSPDWPSALSQQRPTPRRWGATVVETGRISEDTK